MAIFALKLLFISRFLLPSLLISVSFIILLLCGDGPRTRSILTLVSGSFSADDGRRAAGLKRVDDVGGGAAVRKRGGGLATGGSALGDTNMGSAQQRGGVEEAIPVVELRGEGGPMTSAQIRRLEEMGNGGRLLDISVDKFYVPGNCTREARRLDFIVFHYDGYSEAGKLFEKSKSRFPNGIRIQLGAGMGIPGLEKGMRQICAGERRRIKVPYRLGLRRKSRVWKNVPKDEHWLTFDVEAVNVEPWTAVPGQFEFIYWLGKNDGIHSGAPGINRLIFARGKQDGQSDGVLGEKDIIRFSNTMLKQFGKRCWPNNDIDPIVAARYYIGYFDSNKDGLIDMGEFERVFSRDLAEMDDAAQQRSKQKQRRDGENNGTTVTGEQNYLMTARLRDPGLGWVLDFNNDGLVGLLDERNSADRIFRLRNPRSPPSFPDGDAWNGGNPHPLGGYSSHSKSVAGEL